MFDRSILNHFCYFKHQLVILECVALTMNYFITRQVQVHIVFTDTTKEYEVKKDDTIRELRKRVEMDLRATLCRQLKITKLQQDDRKLPDDVKFGKAEIDLKRPLHFHVM